MGDHAVHYYSEAGVKFRHNLVCDILVDICFKVRIMVRKKAPMGFLLEDEKDLRPANLLLFNWLQSKDACLDMTCISPFAGMGYNDHVVSNLSQKRHDEARNGNEEESRVVQNNLVEEIRENSKEMEGGVFRCAAKVNADYNEPTISIHKSVDELNADCLNVNHEDNKDKVNNDDHASNSNKSKETYAKIAMDNKIINNKLWTVPTIILNNDMEVVIFNDELVALGSEKWKLTL
ncbi:hypothetical protein Tco_0492052 [Tanacetum coccineum]